MSGCATLNSFLVHGLPDQRIHSTNTLHSFGQLVEEARTSLVSQLGLSEIRNTNLFFSVGLTAESQRATNSVCHFVGHAHLYNKDVTEALNSVACDSPVAARGIHSRDRESIEISVYKSLPGVCADDVFLTENAILGKSDRKMITTQLNTLCPVKSESDKTQMFVPCLLYTSPSPRDGLLSRMPSSA